MDTNLTAAHPPGVCVSWGERLKEYDAILGEESIVKEQWENLDQLAYLYIWFVLIQF